MQLIYRAEDGTTFDTAAQCMAYEHRMNASAKLLKIAENTKLFSAAHITISSDVVKFIIDYWPDLLRIMEPPR